MHVWEKEIYKAIKTQAIGELGLPELFRVLSKTYSSFYKLTLRDTTVIRVL